MEVCWLVRNEAFDIVAQNSALICMGCFIVKILDCPKSKEILSTFACVNWPF